MRKGKRERISRLSVAFDLSRHRLVCVGVWRTIARAMRFLVNADVDDGIEKESDDGVLAKRHVLLGLGDPLVGLALQLGVVVRRVVHKLFFFFFLSGGHSKSKERREGNKRRAQTL